MATIIDVPECSQYEMRMTFVRDVNADLLMFQDNPANEGKTFEQLAREYLIHTIRDACNLFGVKMQFQVHEMRNL